MGCDYYRLEGDNFIHFCESSAQDDIPCQCTFPNNNVAAGNKLDAYEVASLAMLGATLVLLQHDELTGPAFWPDCLPAWIISEIRKACGLDSDADRDALNVALSRLAAAEKALAFRKVTTEWSDQDEANADLGALVRQWHAGWDGGTDGLHSLARRIDMQLLCAHREAEKEQGADR